MNILLCGPVTGSIKQDYKVFEDYRRKLSKYQGHNFFNPIKLIAERLKKVDKPIMPDNLPISQGDWRWLFDLQNCFSALVYLDAIYLIPGWKSCTTSVIISMVAQRLGLKILAHNKAGKLITRRLRFDIGDRQSGEVVQLGNEPEAQDISSEDFDALLKEIGEIDDEDQDAIDSAGREVKPSESHSDDPLASWFNRQF